MNRSYRALPERGNLTGSRLPRLTLSLALLGAALALGATTACSEGDCSASASCAGETSQRGSGPDREARGDDGGAPSAEAAPPDAAAPGVVVSTAAGSTVITQGKSASVEITIERTGGFEGDVLLQPFAANPKLAIPPVTVPARETKGVLTVTAAPDAPQGTAAPIVVTARALPGEARLGEGALRLFVRGPAGSLDTTFGGGVVVGTLPDAPFVHAVTQADGKVIAISVSGTVVRAVRFDADGTVDASYGGGTGAVVTFAGYSMKARAALDAEGRLLVAGGGIARFTTDGKLDPTWGGTGVVEGAIKARPQSFVADVAAGPGGKVYFAESCTYVTSCPTSGQWLDLVRLTATGGLDTTYLGSGRRGVVGASASPPYQSLGALEVEPNGSVHVGYDTGSIALGKFFGNVLSIAPDGVYTLGYAFGDAEVTPTTARAPSGDLFVMVTGTSASNAQLRRLRTDELGLAYVEQTFGTTRGRAVLADISEMNAPPRVLPGGVVMLAGKLPTAGQFAVVRLNADGSDDTSFAPDGRVTRSLQVATDAAVVVGTYVQRDGSVLAVGGSSGADKRSRIARLWQ